MKPHHHKPLGQVLITRCAPRDSAERRAHFGLPPLRRRIPWRGIGVIVLLIALAALGGAGFALMMGEIVNLLRP